jgi:hypothetical protein
MFKEAGFFGHKPLDNMCHVLSYKRNGSTTSHPPILRKKNKDDLTFKVHVLDFFF